MAQITRRQAPSFKNVQLQHADVEIKLPGGTGFTAVTEIGYSSKVINRTEYRGVAPVAGGVTRGGLQYSANLAIHRAARFQFQQAVMAEPFSRGMFDTYFPIIVSFNHPDWDRVETDTLYVMVDEWGFKSSAGPSVQSLDIPLYCAYIAFSSGGRVESQAAIADKLRRAAQAGVVANQLDFVPQFVIDVLNEEAL